MRPNRSLWSLVGAAALTSTLLCSSLSAQTHDDCPVGNVRHLALTGLDHASMEAAFLASFRGINHREPTGVRGSGGDDTGYIISLYDHYGPYSDDICRAGWNAYAEMRLQCPECSVSPALGDQPAKFLPTTVIVPAPTPVPVPVPVVPPSLVDLTAVYARLTALDTKIDALQSDVTAIRSDTRSIGQTMKAVGVFLAKYVTPSVAAAVVAWKVHP